MSSPQYRQVDLSLTSPHSLLLSTPQEIRASIWYHLEIRDFRSLLLICKSIKQALEERDLEYVAVKLMKLTDLEKAKIEDIKLALSQVHRTNKLFMTVFLPFSPARSMVSLHETVSKKPELQRLIDINHINIHCSKTRHRLFTVLTTVFKSIFTSNRFLRDTAFTIKYNGIAIHLNDLLESDDLFDELAKRNYDVQKLLESIGIKSCNSLPIKGDGEKQMEKLMGLCAVFKLFKCNLKSLKRSRLSATVKKLLVERWDKVYKLLSYIGEEVSLKGLLKIDRAKRFHMIKYCDDIINLLTHKMFDSSSLAKTVAIRTICNAHKVHQALSLLYRGLDQENRALLLKEAKLVEKIYEQSVYLQTLVDSYHFDLALFLKMERENRENFVNHSREILRLCQFGIITIHQLFALNPMLSKELLRNIGALSHLVNHWQLLGVNLLDRLQNQPQVLEFIIFHVHLLLTPAREGQMSFEEFIDNFEEISVELKRLSPVD
jgi:hypothetical protein